MQGLRIACILTWILCASCREATLPAPSGAPPLPVTGAWLAERGTVALDSEGGEYMVRKMRGLGVRWVAVGQEVTMPTLKRPDLRWGESDGALRGFLRRVKRLGLRRFLLPRIESPEFFAPPYPFRADIDFATKPEWDAFHANLRRMVLHYAKLAQAEGVELFGLGLELKHSVKKHPAFWRRVIADVRKVYRGKLTYSANWWDEWEAVEFWGELDYLGVGAYFELRGEGPPGSASVAELVRRWQPTIAKLEAVSQRVGVPVLFTEVGYTGYRDCAERPWEWAGKGAQGVPLDFTAQARALEALFEVVSRSRPIRGLFLWSFYTDPTSTARGDYVIQGRPGETVVQRFFRGER